MTLRILTCERSLIDDVIWPVVDGGMPGGGGWISTLCPQFEKRHLSNLREQWAASHEYENSCESVLFLATEELLWLVAATEGPLTAQWSDPHGVLDHARGLVQRHACLKDRCDAYVYLTNVKGLRLRHGGQYGVTFIGYEGSSCQKLDHSKWLIDVVTSANNGDEGEGEGGESSPREISEAVTLRRVARSVGKRAMRVICRNGEDAEPSAEYLS